MQYPDLELGLHRRTIEGYSVELRFADPESDTESGLGQGVQPVVQFDFNELLSLEWTPLEYGQALSRMLFADSDLKQKFAEFRGLAAGMEKPLRFRLNIGPSAPKLHSLRWETLVDPQSESQFLATSSQIIFSRFLNSVDWRPVKLRSKAKLQALVAISNPADLAEFNLVPIQVNEEFARAQTALAGIQVEALHSKGPVTFNNLIAELREGYDILYLVCHGNLAGETPKLWLEDQFQEDEPRPNTNQITKPVLGRDLVARIKEMSHQPRLVVLASCHSAGTGAQTADGKVGVLAALGPLLSEAGIPAVLAMQGEIGIPTVEQFMPRFFAELMKDGRIDRAMAVARGEIGPTRSDWWMPALFLRLKKGSIWYVPGFGSEQENLERWPVLINQIRNEQCTPILGPGMTDWLFGTRREISQKLAELWNFPMAEHHRGNLPQVAQFRATTQKANFTRQEFVMALCQEMQVRGGQQLPEDLTQKDGYFPTKVPKLS